MFFAISSRLLPAVSVAAIFLSVIGCADTQKPYARTSEDSPAVDFESAANRPPTAGTLFSLAKILAAQGRDYEAGTLLARILREHPDFLPAYYEMVDLRMRHDNVEQAIGTASAGLKVAPNDAILLNNLGMCRMFKGDYKSAQDCFAKAAAADPARAAYRANVAMALGMQGRYDESLATYRQVVKLADAHYNLAVLAEARNDPARAGAEYAAAKKLDPDIQIKARTIAGR